MHLARTVSVFVTNFQVTFELPEQDTVAFLLNVFVGVEASGFLEASMDNESLAQDHKRESGYVHLANLDQNKPKTY